MTFAAQWQEIRALRAVPTHLAASDPDRRRTFAAALHQAEELAKAADVATNATKALMLFYSLSQAGRAIAAAHLPIPWKLCGHGLGVTTVEQPMLETTVNPAPRRSGDDSFHQVAIAIGSPALAGQAQLGAVWAANPDLREVLPPASAGSWPVALEIPIGMQESPMMNPRRMNLSLPTHTTSGVIAMSLDIAGVTGKDIEKSLDHYPTLRDAFGLVDGANVPLRAGPADTVARGLDDRGVMRADIAKVFPVQSSMLDYWAAQRTFASIVEADPRFPRKPYPHYVGFALPELAGGTCPHPLMLWWALLLGLSSLTRYEPACWTAAIDLNSSELAVNLERVLDIAAEKVPQRILEHL